MSGAIGGPQNRAGDSTSPELSSPPSTNSPAHPSTVSNALYYGGGGPSNAPDATKSSTDAGEKSGKPTAAGPSSATKRPRKKRDLDGNASNIATAPTNGGDTPKPVKQRIKRGTGPTAMKKKRLLEEQKAREEAAAMQAAHQARIPEPVSGSTTTPNNYEVPQARPQSQNGNHDAIPAPYSHSQNLTPQPRQSSGQNYDPIRSSTVAPRPSSPMNAKLTPPKPLPSSNATRSPSISSLIDPPSSMLPHPHPQYPKREHEYRPSSPPESKRPRMSPASVAMAQPGHAANGMDYPSSNVPNGVAPMANIDMERSVAAPVKSTVISKKPTPNASNAHSPSTNSPVPSRAKETALPLPTGSGLLSGSIFGDNGLDSTSLEKTGPTVILDVKLDGENQYVNFTRLAEEKYGFNALHPRLAAQRDRLARVAAAGAALENAHKNGNSTGMSADEMSVDLSNDEAENSNVEMGGMNDGEKGPTVKSGEDTGEVVKTRRKRIMKEDMYDKDDDFVDDTELAWEEQAAVSKDGFFVYSGPLVPEGEDAKVERFVALPTFSHLPY